MSRPAVPGAGAGEREAATSQNVHAVAGDPGDFVALFTRHSRRIYAYILTLVPGVNDADEVYQETSRMLWEKFSEFDNDDTGGSFAAWACRVAYFNALSFHRDRRRDRLVFNEDFLQCVGEEFERTGDLLDARHAALPHCIDQLQDRQRRIVEHRYRDGGDVKDIAAHFDTTPNAVYKTLNRVHRLLMDCINKRVEREGLL